MIRIRRIEGKIVEAYCLGYDTGMENKLMNENKLRVLDNGTYELFSRESVNGKGQLAKKGDYMKLDSNGMPYPISAEYFEENHVCISLSDGRYVQMPAEMYAWEWHEAISPEIEFLIKNKGLTFNDSDEDKYYSAVLWGSKLSAARDALIVLYRIDRNDREEITDIDFSFVSREEFEEKYRVC